MQVSKLMHMHTCFYRLAEVQYAVVMFAGAAQMQAIQLTVGYQVTIGVGQAGKGQQGQHDRQQCKLGKHNKAQQAGVLIQACCCNAQQASAQLNLPTPAVQRTLNASLVTLTSLKDNYKSLLHGSLFQEASRCYRYW